MSTQTLANLHEAIAAHIADEGDGVYLTEWVVSASAVIPDKPQSTAYYYYDNDLPIHHAVGLLASARSFVNDFQSDDPDQER